MGTLRTTAVDYINKTLIWSILRIVVSVDYFTETLIKSDKYESCYKAVIALVILCRIGLYIYHVYIMYMYINHVCFQIIFDLDMH